MKYLKTFETYSINEEFNHYDLNKWLASAAGVFGTALNLIMFKWSKIPEIWKNIGDYRTLMSVLSHITKISELGDITEKDWIDLINDYVGTNMEVPVIKYSHITSGPSTNDLSMAYTLMTYDGDLEEDIKESIQLISKLPAERKIRLKDVEELLEGFTKLINHYKGNQSQISIAEL